MAPSEPTVRARKRARSSRCLKLADVLQELLTAQPNDLILERCPAPLTGTVYRLTLHALTLEWRTRQLAEAAALAMAKRAGVAVYMRHPRGLEYIGDHRPRVVHH